MRFVSAQHGVARDTPGRAGATTVTNKNIGVYTIVVSVRATTYILPTREDEHVEWATLLPHGTNSTNSLR